MSTSRAERSRLTSSIAINQDFEFESCRFPDFHAFSKTPPLSKIRQNQEIDEIKRRNCIFVENQKFTDSYQEINHRKAAVGCFFCSTWPRAGVTRREIPTTERHPEGCRSVRPKGPDNVKIGMSLEFYSPAAAVSRNGAAGRGRFPKRRCVPRRENEIRERGSLEFLHV